MTSSGGLATTFTGMYSYIEFVLGTSPFDQPDIGPTSDAPYTGDALKDTSVTAAPIRKGFKNGKPTRPIAA
jgi:hypothetical protein